MSTLTNFATQPLVAYFQAHTQFLAAKFNQLSWTISYRSVLLIAAHPLHCCPLFAHNLAGEIRIHTNCYAAINHFTQSAGVSRKVVWVYMCVCIGFENAWRLSNEWQFSQCASGCVLLMVCTNVSAVAVAVKFSLLLATI